MGSIVSRKNLMTILERLLQRISVNHETGCWFWTGCCNRSGYGMITISSKLCKIVSYVHRVMWEEKFGKIPDGLYVCHHCDNPPCINPDHLFLGTHQDNMDDGKKKGRFASGERHYQFGHPERFFRGENNGMSKLTEQDVRDIRRKFKVPGILLRHLAEEYKVHLRTIQNVVNYNTWKHVV